MKYKLTKETIKVGKRTLHRIEALKDFSDVRKGELGGFVESESNLSQDDDSWVYDDAKVYGYVWVYDCAKICEKAEVFDDAWIHNSARVYGNANVYGSAEVYGNASVYGSAEVSRKAMIYDYARVYGFAEVHGNALVHGNAHVSEKAKVFGNANVYGSAEICKDAKLSSLEDYSVFKNTWSSGRWFTYTKSNKMWKVGCFYGSGKELIKKAYNDSKLSGDCYKTIVKTVENIEKLQKKN